MTELVAVLSTGKGTWSEVAKIINAHEWDKVFLITDQFGSTTFKKKENMEFIILSQEESIETMTDKLQKFFKEKIKGAEVALNMVSGSGKEHMAVLSALLKSGVGIRLITYSATEIKEI
jgi:hypothetical protein